jgi:hypothetical protein
MEYIISPYKKVKYGGKLRSSIKFKTRAGAVKFARSHKLKGARLYLVSRRRK